MNTTLVECDTVSVFEAAFIEVRRHSWIESQKHQRDVSERARAEWYQRFWWTFLRYRHLEHLMGEHAWNEFKPDSFGILNSLSTSRDGLMAEVVEFYKAGWENLDIINWAMSHDVSMGDVYECLVLININDARIDPRFN